jgi:TonB family protein
MGYQALLFCPDEKLARVVSQVFSELDFAIEPVHEPFAAVKKLMAQRYDAIVVDCENEQNASLLFKSARNSSSNQSSLAIAVVEGQAGVAKAYRIGANLVLTKPINVEQAKGTLRVARGLLRKNSDAAGAAGTTAPAMPAKTAPVSTSSSLPPASRELPEPPSHSELPEFEAPLLEAFPDELPAIAASAKVEDKPAVIPAPAAQTRIKIQLPPGVEERQPAFAGSVKNDAVKNEAPPQNANPAFPAASGSAAAPAPAKEIAALPAPQKEAKTAESKAVDWASSDSSRDAAPMFSSGPSFGGLSEEEDSGGSGSKKKILIAVAVLVLAALGYFGYGKLAKSGTPTTTQPVSAPQSSGQSSPAPSPMSTPVSDNSTSAASRMSSAAPISANKTSAAIPLDKPTASTGSAPAIRIAASPDADTKKPDSTPIRVKSNTAGGKKQGQGEDSAPPLPSQIASASPNDSNLSGLMSSSAPSLPKAPLATLKVSQGVSQGLLIKRVAPKYPQAALAVHTQGTVQIEATIDKEGNVVNPKVLSGDLVLARAALDAVRQWRYKPYYLDGEPVEIQTQITITFKAN